MEDGEVSRDIFKSVGFGSCSCHMSALSLLIPHVIVEAAIGLEIPSIFYLSAVQAAGSAVRDA
jgi:hypothetical protein